MLWQRTTRAYRDPAAFFRFAGTFLFRGFTRCCGGLFATTPAARSKRCHASGCNSTSLFGSDLVMTTKPFPGYKREILHLTKVGVAQSQLKTAIRLWFNDGDAVSIHTLACAAYEI